VDDAIVMLGNVMRHIEAGRRRSKRRSRFARSRSRSSRFQLLVAVFIPIFFMGVIGLLFHEFAVVVRSRSSLRLAR
jgi:HAE1 family hydrophobic/amphiphilic exporter-1